MKLGRDGHGVEAAHTGPVFWAGRDRSERRAGESEMQGEGWGEVCHARCLPNYVPGTTLVTDRQRRVTQTTDKVSALTEFSFQQDGLEGIGQTGKFQLF